MNFSQLRIDEQLNEMWMKLSKGKMLFGDFEVLYHFSKGKTCIVELGTAYGLGAMVLSLNGAEVFTVDNYRVLATEKDDIPLHEGQSDAVYRIVKDYLKHFNPIHLVKKTTAEASGTFRGESVDVLYIDADHHYDSVKQDFEIWFPIVRTGGYILFHDYSLMNRGVMDFVDMNMREYERKEIVEEIAFKSFSSSIIKIYEKRGNL